SFRLLHPPRSPLFPYTTLFRSLGPSDLRRHADGSISIGGEKVDNPEDYKGQPLPGGPTDPANIANVQQQAQAAAANKDDRTAQVDRKSTRLNSSHQIISYAVFC